MPNGGPTPDCIHCKYFLEPTRFLYQCGYHDVLLATPIRAFCSDYADNDLDEVDWLDAMLDRQQLQPQMMYVWFEKGEGEFYHVPLVPVVEYNHWTRDRFLEEIGKLTGGTR